MDAATFAAEHGVDEATAAVFLAAMDPPTAAEYVVSCALAPSRAERRAIALRLMYGVQHGS